MENPICKYCYNEIDPNDPHTECEEELRLRAEELTSQVEEVDNWAWYIEYQKAEEARIAQETDAALAAYFAQKQSWTYDDYLDEPCLCGHSHDDHLGDHGSCLVHGCDCDQFGDPPQDYPIKVYFGDPNDGMGFIGYE